MATEWKRLCVIESIKLLRHILYFVVTGRSIDWSDQETEVRFLFCYTLIFLFFSQFIAQNEFLQGHSSQRPLRLRLQNSKISIDRRNGECTRDPLDLLTSPASPGILSIGISVLGQTSSICAIRATATWAQMMSAYGASTWLLPQDALEALSCNLLIGTVYNGYCLFGWQVKGVIK